MEAVNNVAQFPSDLEVEIQSECVEVKMTSRGESKLTSEMMKRAQQHRRTPRHESQHQLKCRGTRIARMLVYKR